MWWTSSSSSNKVHPRWAEYHALGSMVTWVTVGYKHWRLFWRTEVNENGSEMKVECSTCVQLLERKSTCRHWSECKELDTFRHDLIFCCNRNKVISWSKRHHVMLHTIKHGQPLVITPGLQWLPLQIVNHCRHAGCFLVPVACKPSSTLLDLFQFMAILHSVGSPSSGGILHHWAYKSGVTCSLDLLRTWVNVPCSECSVDVSQICYLGCRPTRTCQTRT